MTNPMIPNIYKSITHAPTKIGRHVIIGSGSTVLHGVTIEEGVAIGAMTLVKGVIPSWGIYAGIPCKRIKERSKDLLLIEKEMIDSLDTEESITITKNNYNTPNSGGGVLLSSISLNRHCEAHLQSA